MAGEREVGGPGGAGVLSENPFRMGRVRPSVRRARDVLNELRWREGRDLARAVVWVRGRWADDLKAVRGEEITELGRRYFSTATATIPYYKVVRIECAGEILFQRPDREV